MSRTRGATIALAFGLMFGAGAAPAVAQELSAGWRLLHNNDTTLKRGWYLDADGHLNEVFSVVGEIGGSYRSEDGVDVVSGTRVNVDVNFSVHTFAGGLRLRAPIGGIVPFGQVMFGAVRQAVSVEGSTTVGTRTVTVNDKNSDTDPILDVGGGVNIMTADKFGVRVGLGWMRFFHEGNDSNVFRFEAGA